MPQDSHRRFNPFTNQMVGHPIANEKQTVKFLPEWGIHGFVLNEIPTILSGTNSLSVIQDVAGGSQWTEIDSSLDPSPTEYRLDRKYETGLCEFNAADNGKRFNVTYTGEGTVVNIKNFRELVLSQLLSGGGLVRAGLMENGTPYYRRQHFGQFSGSESYQWPYHNFGPLISQQRLVGISVGYYVGGELHLTGGRYQAYRTVTISDERIYINRINNSGNNEWFFTCDFTL